MQIRLLYRVAVLMFCATLINRLAFANSNCPNPLLVGWETWPPYQYIDNFNQLTGIDIDIVNAIAAQTGCQLLFIQMPWKRQLEEIRSGRLHIAQGASLTEDRQHYAIYSQAYRKETMSVFVLKDYAHRYPYQKLNQLMERPFRLGITLGYYYGEEFERIIKIPTIAEQLEPVASDQLNYYKLLRGRIDGMLADPLTVFVQLKQLQLDSDLVHPLFDLYSNDVHLIFSRHSVYPGVVNDFNQGLQQIQNNGVYKQIMQKYRP